MHNSLSSIIHLPSPIEGSFFTANWTAPRHVKTLMTTRNGGVSSGAYSSLNVGAHVGDDPNHVAQNRAYVQTQVPVPIAYLQQTHSTIVVQAADSVAAPLNADASVDASGKVACAVMTADCLPVLFCDRAGTVVAAAHAGWRGLADGVLQNTIVAMGVPAMEIMAYFAPAIGAESFEVGQDVFDDWRQQIFSRYLRLGAADFATRGRNADFWRRALHRAGTRNLFFLPPRRRDRAHGEHYLVGKRSVSSG